MPKVCPVCGNTYSDSNAFCPSDGTTLRSADVDGDLIGMVVADRYLVTDLLGEGGMGRVYLARHVRLPQQAAIKVLRPALLRDPASVARFNREASNASRIEHERVARVFDFGETSDGTVYLAMEYVPGRTLKRLLADEAPLAPLRAAGLIKQVADGLDAAHRMGIVHRDLKPDNILVLTDDVLGDRAKVVDFGIAKAIGGDTNEAGLTQTGFVVGTPEFMAPEQMLGGLIDGRTDMYALALVAFQCFTNALPFDTTTPDRGLTARITEDPRRLDLVASGVDWPPALQSVFDKALVRDIEKRFATAGAFADALVQAVQGWVGAAVPVPTPGFVPVVPSDSGPVSSGRAKRAQDETVLLPNRDSAKAAPRSRTPLFLAGGAVIGIAAVISVVMMMNGNGNAAVYPTLPGKRVDSTQSASPSTTSTTANPVPSDTPSTSVQRGQVPISGNTSTNQGTANPAATGTKSATGGRGNAGVVPGADGSTTARAIAAAAHDTMLSLKDQVADLDAGRADLAVTVLRRLIPRLSTRYDSLLGYWTLAAAHVRADSMSSACEPLRRARSLALTEKERALVQALQDNLTCVR